MKLDQKGGPSGFKKQTTRKSFNSNLKEQMNGTFHSRRLTLNSSQMKQPDYEFNQLGNQSTGLLAVVDGRASLQSNIDSHLLQNSSTVKEQSMKSQSELLKEYSELQKKLKKIKKESTEFANTDESRKRNELRDMKT